MLSICLTPTSLVIRDLSDELMDEIVKKFDFEFKYQRDNRPYLTGTPTELYKMLYLLSTVYDIEIY